MPRPLGLPKTGGRIRGTPNRRTLAMEEALRRSKIDVVDELAELLPTLEPGKRADVLLSLLPYLYPKRKSLEVSAPDAPVSPRVIIHLPYNGRRAPDQENQDGSIVGYTYEPIHPGEDENE